MRQQFSFRKAAIAFKWARYIVYVLLFCGFVLGSGATAQAQTAIVTIDAPGAGTNGSLSQGTYATSINVSGVITGYFYDSTFGSTFYAGCHGFIRNPDGTYITFDSPMSPANKPPSVPTCAQPASINQRGAVTGSYADPSFGCLNWPDTAGGVAGTMAFYGCGTAHSSPSMLLRSCRTDTIPQTQTRVHFPKALLLRGKSPGFTHRAARVPATTVSRGGPTGRSSPSIRPMQTPSTATLVPTASTSAA